MRLAHPKGIMKPNIRHIVAVLGCLLLPLPGLERQGCALMPAGMASQTGRDVVVCYFGALRRDGSIMVNLVPGAAGQVYRVSPGAPVTLDGAPVGQKYLVNGMPIVLLLNGQKIVDQIKVRPAGGR